MSSWAEVLARDSGMDVTLPGVPGFCELFSSQPETRRCRAEKSVFGFRPAGAPRRGCGSQRVRLDQDACILAKDGMYRHYA
jgi:hypothetical protein